MILASLTDVLAAVDGFVGFGLGIAASWIYWRRRPREYTVNITIDDRTKR
jgi:hypothetical protein